MTNVQPVTFSSIEGFLHSPEEAQNKGLVLTHGAGADCTAPLLMAVADAFAANGFHVLRCNLPFRTKRPKGPPHPSAAAKDREGLAAAVNALQDIVKGRVLLGGHSYGGRQGSMLAASGACNCHGLLLLSYPLHPPNDPQNLRTAHFGDLQTPTLFVHGTTDGFGTVEELRAAVEAIPGPVELVTVEGAGHDLKRGKFDIQRLVVDRALTLLPS